MGRCLPSTRGFDLKWSCRDCGCRSSSSDLWRSVVAVAGGPSAPPSNTCYSPGVPRCCRCGPESRGYLEVEDKNRR